MPVQISRTKMTAGKADAWAKSLIDNNWWRDARVADVTRSVKDFGFGDGTVQVDGVHFPYDVYKWVSMAVPTKISLLGKKDGKHTVITVTATGEIGRVRYLMDNRDSDGNPKQIEIPGEQTKITVKLSSPTADGTYYVIAETDYKMAERGYTEDTSHMVVPGYRGSATGYVKAEGQTGYRYKG